MKIIELFQTRSRFFRSTHLERDFLDASALDGYMLTAQVGASLGRLCKGLKRDSGQRAWRITGDYGSGKSSFALLLAHLFSAKTAHLPDHLKPAIELVQKDNEVGSLVPVLVTGCREPMAVAILRALQNTLEQLEKAKPPQILQGIQQTLAYATDSPIADETVLAIINETIQFINKKEHGTGILIILDEMGKFLEYAALHPDQQDVYLLQRLSETAARSGDQPLFIIGLLHQAFIAYTDQLSQSTEWEKVAGRFDEILFNHPIEQTTQLIAHALNTRTDRIPKHVNDYIQQAMAKTLDAGWFGSSVTYAGMVQMATHIYPLHPTVLPVLVRILNRYGQNERSLFSFLFSNEPFGLQDFAHQHDLNSTHFYRLYHLYDYIRANFGYRLSVQSYRSHWNLIESFIDRFQAEQEVDVQILKTVGILNLLQTPNLLAEQEILALTVDGPNREDNRISQSIQTLQKKKSMLYYRGHAGGYCLWPHTSIDLEQAYVQAKQAIPEITRVAVAVQTFLETRPLVARRHYIQTGNLRHFTVNYISVNDLEFTVESYQHEADGAILVVLCETVEEHQTALSHAESLELLKKQPDILLAVTIPLRQLAHRILNVQRWQWIEKSTPELIEDTYAAEEVSRQIAAAKRELDKSLQEAVGLQNHTSTTKLIWYRQNKPMSDISTGRKLLTYLSDVCDELYDQAPQIQNELVNRHTISSAAAAARMRLIERIFEHPTEPYLGMDPKKKPAEKAMYLSVLSKSGLHHEQDGQWMLTEPVESDSCNVLPTLQRIRTVLQEAPDGRINVPKIFEHLRCRPYGVRDGLIPLLLAVFIKVHEQHVALYEDDCFLPRVTGFDFLRLIKQPKTFDIQYCEMTGIRSELFQRLTAVLRSENPATDQVTLLNIVRTLSRFTAQLPPYTQKTQTISQHTLSVRQVLLNAKEPAVMLFRQLPQACGFDTFDTDNSVESESVQRFVTTLQVCLDELKAAYPELQNKMKQAIAKAFEQTISFEKIRKELSDRARHIRPVVQDIQLQGFCHLLMDNNLPESDWMESFGNFICSKPPRKWVDADLEIYNREVSLLCTRFRRVEAIAYKRNGHGYDSKAVHIAITRSDGKDFEDVFYIAAEEELEVTALEQKIIKMLEKDGRKALAATSRAMAQFLSAKEQEEK